MRPRAARWASHEAPSLSPSPSSPPAPPLGPGGDEGSLSPRLRIRLALTLGLACAAVPLAALLPAAPGSFTRFGPLRLAAAAVALLLLALLATFAPGAPWRRRGPSLGAPGALAAILFLGWSALSLSWSPAPGPGLLTLATWIAGALFVLCLRVVLAAAPRPAPRGATAAGSDANSGPRGAAPREPRGSATPRGATPAGSDEPSASSPATRGASLALLVSLLTAGTALAVLALVQRDGHLRLGLHRVTATLGNPNHLAVALVALLPAALWLGRASRASQDPVRANTGQLAALAYAALLLAGIHATGCHAAWLAVFALALAALLLWPTRSLVRRLALAGGFALGALGLAFAALPRAAVAAGASGRLLITRLGLDVVLEAPWQGAGLGGFADRVAWIQGAHLARAPGPYSPLLDAHQQALMVAGETGFLGLGLALVALGLALRAIWDRRRQPEAHAALVAFAGLAVFSLSETVIRDVGVLMVACTWLALGLGPARATVDEASPALERGSASGSFAGLLGRLRMRARLAPLSRLAPVALLALVAFVLVGEARADHLHARGLARLGRAAGAADRATLLATLRDYDRARASALDAAALDLDRALVLQALGDPARAARAARASFAVLPSPERAVLLGDLAAAADRPPDAILWYQRAVDLHPRYARARNNLGVALLRAGHPTQGCATLRRALSLRPFDPVIRGNWRTLCRPAPSRPPSVRSSHVSAR